MDSKRLYMVVNAGEMDNLSLFTWSEKELQSVISLFTRVNEQHISYAPILHIYACKEEDIIPLEEVAQQSWYEDGDYSNNDLEIFKLDGQSYTWKDRWRSIYDFKRVFPDRFY